MNNKQPRSSSIFLALLVAFFSLTNTHIAYAGDNAGLNFVQINQDEFDYGSPFDQTSTVNHYIDSSTISQEQLFHELNSYYTAQRTTSERIDYFEISNGDTCAATLCVTVVEDYGSYSAVTTRENFNLVMSSGSQGSNNYSSPGSTSTSDSTATQSQINTLANINQRLSSQNSTNSGLASEISSANSELSSLNSEHSRAKSSLASAEGVRNSALSNMNSAISNRASAMGERYTAKQQASNAREEANREAAAVATQQGIKSQQENTLAKLENETAALLAQSSSYKTSISSSKSSLDSNVASAKAEISEIVNRHNAIAGTVINDLGVIEAVEDLDIDYSALIKTNNDLEIPRLPNGQEIKTQKSHPKYEQLVEAINYQKSLEEYVENSADDQVKQAYELSEIGIILADDAYSEGRDAEGDQYLEGALSILDTALDFVPGVSFIKDVTSIVTGVNPITGEDVPDTDRAIMLGALFLPAGLAGTGKLITKTAKALEKLAERGSSKADELINVVRNSDNEIAKYSKSPCSPNVVSVDPTGSLDWVKLIAFRIINFAVPTAIASIDSPCPLGSVTDNVLENNTIRPETFKPGKKNEWSEHLNKPERNHIYKLDNGSYQTDHLGRTKFLEARELTLKTSDRNSYQQGISGGGDRLGTDVGGHLWGSRFNGPGEAINLIPMDKTLNSNAINGGVFGRLEMKWASEIEQGSNVSFSIRPEYTSDSLRPDYFDIVETIAGVTLKYRMYNKPGG